MGAYHNALREEGTREDLMLALEQAWTEGESLRAQLAEAKIERDAVIERLNRIVDYIVKNRCLPTVNEGSHERDDR